VYGNRDFVTLKDYAYPAPTNCIGNTFRTLVVASMSTEVSLRLCVTGKFGKNKHSYMSSKFLK